MLVYLLIAVLVAAAWIYSWKILGSRRTNDAYAAFEPWMEATVGEPLEAVAAATPGGTVGRQARGEWAAGLRTLTARAATGAAVHTPGSSEELPPTAGLGLAAEHVHLVPYRFGAGNRYELAGEPIAMPRADIVALARAGALTINLELRSEGVTYDLELARDPVGRNQRFVEVICAAHPG